MVLLAVSGQIVLSQKKVMLDANSRAKDLSPEATAFWQASKQARKETVSGKDQTLFVLCQFPVAHLSGVGSI